MILSIVLIVLVLCIALIHYIQGFFSATLSAIIAVIAAAVAIGYNETLVNMMKPGKFADNATAAFICLLFLVTYVILRIIFDKAIQGNVRFNPTVDKVGAAIMGLIAGVFATGVIGIAAQSLPIYSGSLATRYATNAEQNATGSYGESRAQDIKLYDQMKSPVFKPEDVTKLVVPVDDWVLGTVSNLSSGTLSTGSAFTDVHPDYLTELFGQRAGVQAASKHTATNYPGATPQVSVEGVFYLPKASELQYQDSEIPPVRQSQPDWYKEEFEKIRDKPVLIVRLKMATEAADASTNMIGLSPGSVRLVVPAEKDSQGQTKSPAVNVYPVGTLDKTTKDNSLKLWMNRIDDYLFADAHGETTVDFVFPLPEDVDVDRLLEVDPKTKAAALKDGTFIEVKRLARVDLSNKQAFLGTPKINTGAGLIRQTLIKPPEKK